MKVFLAMAISGSAICLGAAAPHYDVVVYGGSSAGAAAAVQCARMGKKVVLIEPSRHIGGMTVSGLGFTDTGETATVGGIAREFYRRVHRYYSDPAAWRHAKVTAKWQDKQSGYLFYNPNSEVMWTFEPSAAEKIIAAMLQEFGAETVTGERLDLDKGVEMNGRRVAKIVMESGRSFEGKVFIDATYEGDLMKLAGVEYTVGREGNSQYGENSNGIQSGRRYTHNITLPVDPYVKKGDKSSGLLPGIESVMPAPDGEADKRLQAYCFRMCLTDVEDNRVPFTKPENFDESEYEIYFRHFEAGFNKLPMTFSMMPNRKTDSNGMDFIGRNYAYPEAGYTEREQIVKAHRDFQQGMLWALQNHPRVPGNLRRDFARWGLPKDEFTDNGNWPYMLYIREARRMVGDYVMTELDCRHERAPVTDPVGFGSYAMDSHYASTYVDDEGLLRYEGAVENLSYGPYGISYRSIIPKNGQCENLLVPVCISASHVAYGSVRMEPVFMILGQSAGAAAAITAENGSSLHSLDYAALRRRLEADGQILSLPPGVRPRKGSDAELKAARTDPKAKLIGKWSPRTIAEGGIFDLTGKMPESGVFEIRFIYTDGLHAAFMRRCTIRHEGETIANDKHQGFSGLVCNDHVYRFNTGPAATGKYTLEVDFNPRNDSGAICDSNGEIWMVDTADEKKPAPQMKMETVN